MADLHADGAPVATSYYIVAVDSDGDVMALRAELIAREGLDVSVRTHKDVIADRSRGGIAFENQGADAASLWESASNALAAIMPDEDA